jgi:hypothetical protein
MTDYSKWDNFRDSSSDDDDDDAERIHGNQCVDVDPPQVAPQPTLQSATQLLESVTKVELLGEEIMTERNQLVELDRKLNQNREAIAALRRKERESGSSAGAAGASASSTAKLWMCGGDQYMRRQPPRTPLSIHH